MTPTRSTADTPAAPPESTPAFYSRRTLGWAAVLILVAWFFTLDARHLLRSDEGRYAEIAREMFASGDWVTIRYNGLKYFEKPPFHMWMTALAYHAFGVGEWQARLWVAVSGMVGMSITALAAYRWYGKRVALLAFLVLLAAPTWNLGSHFNALDMGVSAALSCVLAGVLIAQHPEASSRQRSLWMHFAWVAMAVAVLTKGLIGIALPGLVLILYTPIARDWRLWTRLHLVTGLLLFMAVAAPWFVLVSMRNPDFAHFFFIHEHWERYTTTVHHRTAPVWYFLPQVLLGFSPWLGLMWGMQRVVRDERTVGSFRPVLLLTVWAAAIFVFFSLSSSKLPGYIIPIFPALAVIAALALDRLGTAAWRRQLIGMLVFGCIAVLASPLVARIDAGKASNALYGHYAAWVVGASVVALAGFVVAFRINRIGQVLPSIGVAAVGFFVAATLALVGHETLGRATSGVDLLPPIEAVLTPDMPIYSVRLLDHTLPFYLRRTTIMVESPDELEFGTQQEPAKWKPTVASFVDAWLHGPHAIALMDHENFATLQRQGVPMVPVAEDARRVVVANFRKPAP